MIHFVQKSLKRSILAVILLIIFIMFIGNLSFLYNTIVGSVLDTIQENGEHDAERIASEIDAEQYEKFLKNPNGKEYKALVEQLNNVRKNN